MFEIGHDLRSALRRLSRRPLYPIITVAVLALGLSAGVAVFTYVNGFYQPFPGADADGLVRFFGVEEDNPFTDISYLDFLDYAAVDGAFEKIAAVQPYYAASVRRAAMTEVAFLEAVSGDYFAVLDVKTSLGRGLTAADDRTEAEAAAVVSHDWWHRSFNADSSILGTTLYLNFRPHTVVGVASPEFRGSASDFRPDVWIPIAPFRARYTSWSRLADNRDVPLVRVFGRLRPGVDRDRAVAELSTVATRLDAAYPRATESRSVRIESATWIDPRSRLAEMPTVRLMLVAAGGLLLLVCANVANLLLAVSIGRQREMAMRSALGASPGRLLRGVFAENVLLSSVAAGVALLLAGPISARLGSYFARPSIWGENVSREITLDAHVVLFALAISIVTGAIIGIFPAVRASRRNLVVALKDDAHTVVSWPRGWRRRLPDAHGALVSAQVALSVVLLVLAGLVLRTLASVGNLDPGFSYEGLVGSHVSTSSTTMQVDEREAFFRDLAVGVAAEPWVRAATVSDNALLSPHGSAEFRIAGQSEPVTLVTSRVVPGFFQTVGIELLRGRRFATGDSADAPAVAMVNETAAQRFFPGGEAVGRRIWRTGGDGGIERSYEIVGLLRDAKTRDFLTDAEPVVYLAYSQHPYPTGSALLLSTTIDPAAAVPLLYRWLREFEPHLAIVNALPYTEVVRGFLYTQRMNAELFSALAFLALGLAAVGIFSVTSLAVSRRTREIGIRMALGARRGDIGRLVVGRVLNPLGLGLAVGLAAAFAGAGLVRGLLHGVEPADPMTVIAGVGVLVAAALAATFPPARRATAVDPVTALRRD